MNEIEVYYDEAYSRQSSAWFWCMIDCHDDECVGPFRTKEAAAEHARLNGYHNQRIA